MNDNSTLIAAVATMAILLISTLVASYVAVWAVESIVRDCETLGAFRVDDIAYACQKVSR